MKKAFLLFLFWLTKSECSIVLRRFKPQILAVTGSIAKSSTKEAIFAVLETKLGTRVQKSYGNLNNELGAPLAILGFKKTPKIWEWPFVIVSGFFKAIFVQKYPKWLILELAADKPGDLDYLLSFISPKIGVVTAVGPSHLEAFKTVENVVKEKEKLPKALPKNGMAVLNRADSRVYEMRKKTKAEVVFFHGTDLDIAENAARKVGQIFKIKKTKIEKALKSSKGLRGRLDLLSGIRNSKIIDDSYNSNPLSCGLTLDFLNTFEGKRKVAILGDMLELGDFAPKAHQEIAKKAAKIVDLLILVGKNFEKCKKENSWYPDSITAAKNVSSQIKENDVILVKGSRGIKMEKIVTAIAKER